ncbi:hypothetical protein D9M72_396680 [compost metagenome]
MVLRGSDAAAEGDAYGDGHLDGALGAVVELGHLGHDLVEGRIDEPVELDFHHRPVAAVGQADGGAHDAGLGERGVHNTVLAEVLLQAVGHAEDAAERADVLPHQDDLGVVFKGFAEAGVDCPGKGHLRHQRAPSSELAAAGSPKDAR